VGRAGDAWVVVADRLLAFPLQLVVAKVEPARDEAAKVILDSGLVLRGWWNDARRGDEAVRVELVPVVENAARGSVALSDPK
jgi:hypothetical protein